LTLMHQMTHIRLGKSIRVRPAALEAYLQASTNGNESEEELPA